MKKSVALLVPGLIVCLWNFSSWADTDYRCLNQCVKDGKPTPTCLDQCSYGPQSTSLPRGVAPISSHKLFDAPKPSDGTIILPPKVSVIAKPKKDYRCFNDCLGNKMQYSLCEDRCTLTDGKMALKESPPPR